MKIEIPYWEVNPFRTTFPGSNYVKEDEGARNKEDRIIITIHHLNNFSKNPVKCNDYGAGKQCHNPEHWRIQIKKVDYRSADDPDFIRILEEESSSGKHMMTDKLSERKVLLQADARTPFVYIKKLLREFRKDGIYKLEFGAGVKIVKKNKEE